MSYANDRVEAARRRSLDITHNTQIEVYEPTESYSAGDGYTLTRPDPDSDVPDATYDAHARDPDRSGDRDRGGTSVEADRVISVRDDLNQTWTGFGESGEAAVHIRDTSTGDDYEVVTVSDNLDGRLELDCAEV